MKHLLIVVALGIAVFGAYRKGIINLPGKGPAPASFAPAVGAGEDPCKAKRFCVMVYMAPWCPHCKNAVSSLQNFAEKSRKPDFPG